MFVLRKINPLKNKIEPIGCPKFITLQDSMSNTRYFKVTLTLEFRRNYPSAEDLVMETLSWFKDTKKKFNEKFNKKVKDYEATDAKFNSYEKIVAHVKSNDPYEFIAYIPDHYTVSAEWDPKDFKIHFIIQVEDPEETVENIRKWIRLHSLEDGAYESCGDNGWTVKTLAGTGEYGLTDYRDNPIIIEEVDPKTGIAAA
jgi:hypothetical protein